MTEREFEANRIIEIGEGVALIGDVKYLDGTTSYRTGRLGDFCKPIVRSFAKERDKMVRDAREKERKIRERVKDASAEEKSKANDEISDIVSKLNEELDSLSTQIEKIRVPELKLSSFIAKADITEITKDGDAKVVVKAGQSLVPVKFFTLMGDVIIDDKEANV